MILLIAAIFILFAAACTTLLQVTTHRPGYASVPEQGHRSYFELRCRSPSMQKFAEESIKPGPKPGFFHETLNIQLLTKKICYNNISVVSLLQQITRTGGDSITTRKSNEKKSRNIT